MLDNFTKRIKGYFNQYFKTTLKDIKHRDIKKKSAIELFLNLINDEFSKLQIYIEIQKNQHFKRLVSSGIQGSNLFNTLNSFAIWEKVIFDIKEICCNLNKNVSSESFVRVKENLPKILKNINILKKQKSILLLFRENAINKRKQKTIKKEIVELKKSIKNKIKKIKSLKKEVEIIEINLKTNNKHLKIGKIKSSSHILLVNKRFQSKINKKTEKIDGLYNKIDIIKNKIHQKCFEYKEDYIQKKNLIDDFYKLHSNIKYLNACLNNKTCPLEDKQKKIFGYKREDIIVTNKYCLVQNAVKTELINIAVNYNISLKESLQKFINVYGNIFLNDYKKLFKAFIDAGFDNWVEPLSTYGNKILKMLNNFLDNINLATITTMKKLLFVYLPIMAFANDKNAILTQNKTINCYPWYSISWAPYIEVSRFNTNQFPEFPNTCVKSYFQTITCSDEGSTSLSELNIYAECNWNNMLKGDSKYLQDISNVYLDPKVFKDPKIDKYSTARPFCNRKELPNFFRSYHEIYMVIVCPSLLTSGQNLENAIKFIPKDNVYYDFLIYTAVHNGRGHISHLLSYYKNYENNRLDVIKNKYEQKHLSFLKKHKQECKKDNDQKIEPESNTENQQEKVRPQL